MDWADETVRGAAEPGRGCVDGLPEVAGRTRPLYRKDGGRVAERKGSPRSFEGRMFFRRRWGL